MFVCVQHSWPGAEMFKITVNAAAAAGIRINKQRKAASWAPTRLARHRSCMNGDEIELLNFVMDTSSMCRKVGKGFIDKKDKVTSLPVSTWKQHVQTRS